LKVLSSGIDSLYVSFRGEVRAELLDDLEVLKAKAQETGQPQVVGIPAGQRALVQPSGWGSYRYWLRCGDFDLFVGRGTRLPAVYARLASSFIHEVGTSRALAELTYFVESATLPEAGDALSSRVDVYADFQGWVPRPRDYERFVTRSRRNTWHVAVHHDGRQFTGFTFGRDAMVASLYDKGAEIAHSGKSWMRAIWGDRLDPTKPVWRIEFQLRREVLSDCNLSEPEESCGGARTCGATRCGGCRCDRQGLECGEQDGRLPAHGCTFHAWSSGLRRARWCVTASKNTISLYSSVALPATRARWQPSRV